MPAIDYEAWAQRYDTTRGASPSVLSVLLRAFGDPRRRTLIDIGGGTGNFAQPLAGAGFRVSLCDVTAEMIHRATTRLPDARLLAIADAQRLPFLDATFDCALSVNVLGHIPDWRAALAEARRVVRQGPLVLKVSTLETQKSNWVLEYLPQIRDRTPPYHYQDEATTQEALLAAGFRHIVVDRVYYRDAADGSFQALKWFPNQLLDDDRILNTAVFMRLPEAEAREALDRIRADHESGRLTEVLSRYEATHLSYGDGTVFICHP